LRLLALLLRRLAWFVPTLLGLLAITFVISRVVPADPVALVAGETATPAQVEALRRQLGFDRPLPVQFVTYVARLARGDMGRSLYTMSPIADDLATRPPATPARPLGAGHLGALHEGRGAGRDAVELRPLRAGDGNAALRDRLEVYFEVRPHLHGAADRPAVRHPPRGGGGHRDGVRLAGHRHVRRQLHHSI